MSEIMNIAYPLSNLLESIHVEMSKWLFKNLPLQEIQGNPNSNQNYQERIFGYVLITDLIRGVGGGGAST